MVGVCGVIGKRNHDVGVVATDLLWTGDETRVEYADDSIQVVSVFHEKEAEDQPATAANGDVLVWVWGNVYGVEADDGYRRLRPDESIATTVARLYDEYGLDFVSRLNGEFFGLVYDRPENTASFFEDRFGVRDAYYARPQQGTLVFSTHAQALTRHPDLTPEFHPKYVREFLVRRRVPGAKTPIRGVRMFAPGAITTFDPTEDSLTERQFWTVQYRPVDRPLSYFVDAFVERFRDAVAERTAADGSYGLMLSGGLDSRLHLAALTSLDEEVDVTAYTISGWMNREARMAERVALTAGVDFEMLRRDERYHERGLERNPKLSNFIGSFDQAHAEGFSERLRSKVDYVLDNNHADSLVKGFRLPSAELSLGSIGTLEFPWLDKPDSFGEFLDETARNVPKYVSGLENDRELLATELERDGERIRYFDLWYDSFDDFALWGGVFPRTHGNSLFAVHSLRHNLPYRNPFVDNRIADLVLSMPPKHLLRKSLVVEGIERLNPELAEFPHAADYVPIKYPYWLQYVANKPLHLLNTQIPLRPKPPLDHEANAPWQVSRTIVQNQNFPLEKLYEHKSAIQGLPFLDWDGALQCYRDVVSDVGADGETDSPTRALYTLLTFLEMPATQRVVGSMGVGGESEARGVGEADEAKGVGEADERREATEGREPSDTDQDFEPVEASDGGET